jgi:hypothetical protein
VVVAAKGSQIFYAEACGFQQLLKRKGGVAAPIVGHLMERPEEGYGEQQRAAGFEHSMYLYQQIARIRTVLQHLGAQSTVDRFIR